MTAPTYTVLVSNLGTVYKGDDKEQAQAVYDQYKADSINVIGRAAGESITLTYKGEPMTEYVGVLGHEAPDAAPTQGVSTEDKEVCHCVRCTVGRQLLKALGRNPTIVDVMVDANDVDALDVLTRGYIEAIGSVEGIQVRDHDALRAAIIKAVVENTAGG